MTAPRSGMPGDVTQRDLTVTERVAAAELARAVDGQKLAGVELDGARLVSILARTPRGRQALRKQLSRRGLTPR